MYRIVIDRMRRLVEKFPDAYEGWLEQKKLAEDVNDRSLYLLQSGVD